VTDPQQILRLLATIREEVADIRSRQEELYELLISYKDQVQDVKKTVEEGLEGLPRSPYVAGQLIPAPDQIDGADEFGHMLATYLHKHAPWDAPDPKDVTIDPPPVVHPDDVHLEAGENFGGSRRRGNRGPRMDTDLERGPDRDIVPLDLDDDESDKKKKKRRRRRRKKKTSSESA
jgi:hypothetical protein